MKSSALFRHTSAVIVLVVASICQAYSIESTQPNHYFYTPTAYLNGPYELVASLHEASYTFPYKLQVYTSLIDNIGRVCFGARYGILGNLSVGSGLAWSITTLYWGRRDGRRWGGHGIHHDYDPRFGLFLTWGIANEAQFEAALTPHLQIGDHFSTGGDFGMMITPNPFWSIIGEFGFSYDVTDGEPYLNTIWGARVHPPQIPFLSFDGGVDFVETPPRQFAQHFAPFFDVIFTMRTIR
jgi:hypothetical protein